MTKESLERAKVLSEWIEDASQKLSWISEKLRLYTERKDEDDEDSQPLVSVGRSTLIVKERWNYENEKDYCDDEFSIESWIVIKALKAQEQYLIKNIQKAQKEFEEL